MGQNGTLVTFSGTDTAKQWYSAHFWSRSRRRNRCFLAHIDKGTPLLRNGILAAGMNGWRADASCER